jgi:hypothetical protein
MCVNDMDWIVILFVIYLYAFRVEKLEESSSRVILMTNPSLENWSLKPSRVILRHQTEILRVKKFLSIFGNHDTIIHIDTFSMVQKPCQSELVRKSYASRKLTYRIDHHGRRGCHVSPCYSHLWGYTRF